MEVQCQRKSHPTTQLASVAQAPGQSFGRVVSGRGAGTELVDVGAGTGTVIVGIDTAAVGHVRPATDREWAAALCTAVQERHGWERREPPQR